MKWLLILSIFLSGCISCPTPNYEEIVKAKRAYCDESRKQYDKKRQKEYDATGSCKNGCFYTPFVQLNPDCAGYTSQF